jgi:phosphatidylglycerophosphate synthase
MHGSSSDPIRNRRPIAARELKSSRRAAAWLARCGVSANAISVAGMIAGLLAGFAFVCTHGAAAPVLWLAAAALIQLRLVANMLDGMVALESGTASKLGELYNEVPDRVSDSATLIGLGYALGGDVVLGYAAASAAIATAYIRVLGVAAGAPAEFCGPMAKQQRMFVATATAAICGIAALFGTTAALGGYGVPALVLALITAGSIVTAVRRLLRIAVHLRGHA